MILSSSIPDYHVWRGPDQVRYTIWIKAHFYRFRIAPPDAGDRSLLYAGNDLAVAQQVRDRANRGLDTVVPSPREGIPCPPFNDSLFTEE